MSADLEPRIDAKLAAERQDVLRDSVRVTEALKAAGLRWSAAKDHAEDAWERYERRGARVNWQAWNDAEDAAERLQAELHRLGAQHARLAAHHDRLVDPKYRQRLIDQAEQRRERSTA